MRRIRWILFYGKRQTAAEKYKILKEGKWKGEEKEEDEKQDVEDDEKEKR